VETIAAAVRTCMRSTTEDAKQFDTSSHGPKDPT
jgi:hypothetical protein